MDNKNMDDIFEKYKQKLTKKRISKEEKEISARISRELEENKIQILNVTDWVYGDENTGKTYSIDIHIPYDTNASNEKKINELIKKWRKEELIDTVNKKSITVYRFRLK